MSPGHGSNLSFLSRVGTALPPFAYPQMALFEAVAERLPLEPKQRKALQGLYKHSGIETRHSVLPDFLADHTPVLYADPSADFPPLSARMAQYQQHALPLALAAVQDLNADLSAVTHVIAVSCTGLSAPGLDLMLLRALDLPAHTQRTCVHYMGCYAALHALKQADAICRAHAEAQVLVVCVELCTLHFQGDTCWDHLTSSLLFADGAAAVLVGSRPFVNTPPMGLRHFYSEVALDGWDEMSWHPHEKGFLMRLGRGVPFLLKDAAEGLIQRALAPLAYTPQDIAHWAIHPGGRLILDLLIRELALDADALWASRQVLKRYGNMSSATVLFVLQALQQTPLQGPLFMAAFGPGLTMETALCEAL